MRDEYGSEVKSWAMLATVWACVEPLSPTAMSGIKEVVAAGAELSQDMVRVTIRPRDVTALDRFVFRDRVYSIKASRMNNAGDEMTLFASVGAAAGSTDSVSVEGGNAASPGPGSISGGNA